LQICALPRTFFAASVASVLEMRDMKDNVSIAIGLAASLHEGQLDKGGQPYILHALRVMMQMDTHQEQIVAVLHDSVEDTHADIGGLKADFGGRVAEAIDALTKRKGESYDDYLCRVKSDELATKVKLADLKDNCDLSRLGRTPTIADRERLDKYLRARAILQS
jgi:(p)ppGpp synthase/HD superfamily hydrolase